MKETQNNKKIEKLVSAQHPLPPTMDKSQVVINLTSIQLDDDTTNVLAKVLYFAVPPRMIPKEEIINALETTCRHLPAEVAGEIRLDTASRYFTKRKTTETKLKQEDQGP